MGHNNPSPPLDHLPLANPTRLITSHDLLSEIHTLPQYIHRFISLSSVVSVCTLHWCSQLACTVQGSVLHHVPPRTYVSYTLNLQSHACYTATTDSLWSVPTSYLLSLLAEVYGRYTTLTHWGDIAVQAGEGNLVDNRPPGMPCSSD